MVIPVSDNFHFQAELNDAGNKLVFVSFMASWCEACHQFAPLLESLSLRYPDVVFLNVDMDQCTETVAMQKVAEMHTFVFFRRKVEVDRLQGIKTQALEVKLRELSVDTASDEDQTKSAAANMQGHIDLVSLIDRKSCECLNDSDNHPFSESFVSGKKFLESDCDEQLILSYGFIQAVKLHSLKIIAPEDKGPRMLKLFINQTCTLDFDQVDSMEPVQTIVIKPEELAGELVQLHHVKYQNVQNLQIFVGDNQSGTDTTRIDHLAIIGCPIHMTNVNEFKRVAGKKGESH